jgi:precorrin isomerase
MDLRNTQRQNRIQDQSRGVDDQARVRIESSRRAFQAPTLHKAKIRCRARGNQQEVAVHGYAPTILARLRFTVTETGMHRKLGQFQKHLGCL